MVSSHAWWCLPLALAIGCANADTDEIADAQDWRSGLVCGIDISPSPQTVPATACEDGRTILGPLRVERERGAPHTTSASFELEQPGEVCITLAASGGGGSDEPRATPFTWLDDDRIAAPNNFAHERTLHELYQLDAATHELEIKLAGKPGSWLDVEVREAFAALDTGLDLINDDGSLRLTSVATDHPLITPNGDGHHDDTLFNAAVEPLQDLPGKDDGTVDYFLEWTFTILDLDTCGTIDAGLSGTTAVNSPTRITALWDGTDVLGATVPDGNYAYIFDVTLIDQFGVSFGTIQSPAYGLVVDSAPANYDEAPTYLGECSSSSDPTNCRCPGSGGVPGVADPNCSFQMSQHLLPEAGFPPHTQPNYYDPSVIDKSFITTTHDPQSGRYLVTADLRTYSAGGLISKGDGIWDSEATLRQWVADMTGVPVSSGDSLFNFDYVQLGHSTGVTLLGIANHNFNHFFLDAITDEDGQITVNGVTTDLAAFFNSDDAAPSQFAVDGREDDECTTSANTNGVDTLTARFCATNTAVAIGDATDLGVYSLRTALFGIELNGIGTQQDELCVINGIYSCGVRTWRVPADTLDIEANYYTFDGELAQFSRTESLALTDAASVSLSADRDAGDDGVCSRAVTTRNGLVVRMDSADGAVPETCVINGVIPF